MTAHILVAYATRAGSTAEVAEMIGRVLRKGGATVDIRPVKDVNSLMGYDGLVIGSAIWVGKPLPEAMQFADAHRAALADLPVAYFVLCDTLRQDTPANRNRARGYLDPLLTIKQPVSVGLFGGARDFGGLHLVLRWLLKHVVRLPEGDWRNWDEIRAWAAELPARLQVPAPAGA